MTIEVDNDFDRERDERMRRKIDTCVSGYCLSPNYNYLELPHPGNI